MALNVEAFDAPAVQPFAATPFSAQSPANVGIARWSDRGYLTREADIVSLTPEPLPQQLQQTPQVVEVAAARNWTPLDDIAGSVVDSDRAALIGEGAVERALSSAIAARSTQQKKLTLPGL